MSNPGVLYLVQKGITNGNYIRIEDNIGEAIHIHYNNEWRIDLSVKEFLALQNVIGDCLDSLFESTRFKIKYFDPVFLDSISNYLIDLEEVTFEEIKLSEIKVLTRNYFGLPVVRSLQESRIVKALNGFTNELKQYKQENYKDQDNEERLKDIMDTIAKFGYPFDEKYIVLFNEQNNVRDGQHRAGCLYYLYGSEHTIPIIRMHFKDKRYNVSMYPWIATIFAWNRRRILKLLKKFYSFVKKIFRHITRIVEM